MKEGVGTGQIDIAHAVGHVTYARDGTLLELVSGTLQGMGALPITIHLAKQVVNK